MKHTFMSNQSLSDDAGSWGTTFTKALYLCCHWSSTKRAGIITRYPTTREICHVPVIRWNPYLHNSATAVIQDEIQNNGEEDIRQKSTLNIANFN